MSSERKDLEEGYGDVSDAFSEMLKRSDPVEQLASVDLVELARRRQRDHPAYPMDWVSTELSWSNLEIEEPTGWAAGCRRWWEGFVARLHA